MARIAYIRVSTQEQSYARQLELFKDLNIDKYYEEKASGKNISERPELIKMMEYVREGDVVIVESIDRFGRSVKDLITLIEELNKKGVQFRSLKEGHIDTTTPTGKLIYSLFSELAEFERISLKEAQLQGIAIAKKQGKYKGRKPKPFNKKEFIKLYNLWQQGLIKKHHMCRMLKVSASTLDNKISDYRNGKL